MKKTAGIVASLLVLAAASLPAEITFSTPYISDNNDILFEVTHRKPGESSYPTFFTARIDGGPAVPQQITSYPEQLSVLMGGKGLRVRNRYGTTHYNVETRALLHSSTTEAEAISTASAILAAESASPDGKWICSIQQTGPVTGKIILRNAAGYTETELIPQMEGGTHVCVQMTLTAPNCPMADYVMDQVKTAVEDVPGVVSVNIDLVFEPVWDKSRMSEEALVELGLDD